MISLNYTELLCLISLPVTLILAASCYSLQKRSTLVQQKFSTLQEEYYTLEHQHETLTEKAIQQREFAETLKDAEVTTILQEPRLKRQQPSHEYRSPNRYTDINKLSDNQMAPDKLATALSISSQEAQQIMSLSRLAQAA